MGNGLNMLLIMTASTPIMALMARERASVRRGREKGGGLLFPQPFGPASPFACGSRVTSRDSPKWRVGSKANACLSFLKHLISYLSSSIF